MTTQHEKGTDDLNKVVDDYTKGIEKSGNANNSNYYWMLGLVYIKSEQYQKAIDDYTKGIEKSGNLINLCIRGVAYTRLGQNQKAVDDFYEAGLLYLKDKNKTEVLECVDSMNEADPTSPLIKKLTDKIYEEKRMSSTTYLKIDSFYGEINLASILQIYPKGKEPIGDIPKALLESALKYIPSLPVKSFNFLLTTIIKDDVFHFGLTCHIESFCKSYKDMLSLLFSDPKGWQDRVKDLPKVSNLKCNIGLGKSVPHMAVLTEPNNIAINCIEQPFYKIEFPINTSTLLLIISSVSRGKWVNFSNLDIKKLHPEEAKLMKLLIDIKEGKRSFQINDFEVDSVNPENWRILL